VIKVKNERSRSSIVKAIMVVFSYLLLLLFISVLARNEMGSMAQGFYIILYGFYSFTYFIVSLKDGFPIIINQTTDDVFWFYVIIGMAIYFLTIFISHYYLLKKTNKKRLLIVTVNIIIIISYLFFEASILGFATV
jgi:hypothetical protein